MPSVVGSSFRLEPNARKRVCMPKGIRKGRKGRKATEQGQACKLSVSGRELTGRIEPGRAMTATEQASRAGHLSTCKQASRTYTVRLSNIPANEAGQPLTGILRKPTSRIHSIERTRLAAVYGPEVKMVLEESKPVKTSPADFEYTVHLHGISARTFKQICGMTNKPTTVYEPGKLDRLLGKIHAHSPCEDSEDYDSMFAYKMLLQTRKGKKLVQKPASGKLVVLPSSGQLERAGIEFDYRIPDEETESIPVVNRADFKLVGGILYNKPGRIPTSRAFGSIEEPELALNYARFESVQRAINRADKVDKGKPGKPLDVPDIEDADIGPDNPNLIAYKRLQQASRAALSLGFDMYGPGF